MKYTLTPEQVTAMQAINTPDATWVPCWGDTGVAVDTDSMQAEAFAPHLAYLSTLPPQVPATVTALQGEMAIASAGRAAEYQAFVESLPFLERSIWMRQTHWNINDPLIIAGADAIGVGDMLQDLFTQASRM